MQLSEKRIVRRVLSTYRNRIIEFQSRVAFSGILACFIAVIVTACGDYTPGSERAVPSELPQRQRASNRRLALEGASNFRELGGYLTEDGREVKWGMLYRSDSLDNLTEGDLVYLERLGLRAVVDLRSESERLEKPNMLPDTPGLSYVENPIEVDGTAILEIADQILSGDMEDIDLYQMLIDGNKSLVLDHAEEYGQLLRALADSTNFPMVFHCTGGKDRAGFGAALVLLTLGVSREAVMRDYLLTNHYLLSATRKAIWSTRLASLFRADSEQLRPLFMADRAYLESALSTIEEYYGTFDVYLREGLNINQETQDQIRANLLSE